MSKPEDIPQDVWAYVIGLTNNLFYAEVLQSKAGVKELSDAAWHDVAVIARAIMAAKAERLPKFDNAGTYLAKDNTGQWHYINHAGTWQGCPPPFPSVEDERREIIMLCDDEIEQAKKFGPHHVPIIVSIRAAIRKRGTP